MLGDCAEDNEFSNKYYEKAGYIIVGKCMEEGAKEVKLR